ncbi:MAG: DUF4339 domain-containing protein [Pseudobdellovibrionaceae bacterium]
MIEINVKWYFNKNLKPQGPLNTSEVRSLINRGVLGPQDLIYNDNESVWKPACEWKGFEATLFPAHQELRELNNSRSLEVSEWVLLVPTGDGKVLQQGPFSTNEICDQLSLKRISIHQYVWKAGLTGWCRIKDRPEFSL